MRYNEGSRHRKTELGEQKWDDYRDKHWDLEQCKWKEREFGGRPEPEGKGFHSNPKEKQCQRMLKLPHNCTHLTR